MSCASAATAIVTAVNTTGATTHSESVLSIFDTSIAACVAPAIGIYGRCVVYLNLVGMHPENLTLWNIQGSSVYKSKLVIEVLSPEFVGFIIKCIILANRAPSFQSGIAGAGQAIHFIRYPASEVALRGLSSPVSDVACGNN